MGKSGQSLGCLRLIGTNQPIFMHSPLFTCVTQCVTQCVAAQQFQSNQTKPNQTKPNQPTNLYAPLPCLRVEQHSSFKALFMTTVFAQIQSMINKDPLFNVRVRFTVSINCCAPFFYCSFHPLNYPFFYNPVKCSQNGMHQKRILSERRHPPFP